MRFVRLVLALSMVLPAGCACVLADSCVDRSALAPKTSFRTHPTSGNRLGGRTFAFPGPRRVTADEKDRLASDSRKILMDDEIKYGLLSEKHSIVRYVNGVLKKLTDAQQEKSELIPKVYVLKECKEMLGYALPDGSIVVSLPMLGLLQTEDELAFLLAHELTHIQRGHAKDDLKVHRSMKEGVGSLRLKEYEADLTPVVNLLGQAGYYPLAGETFFQHIIEQVSGSDWGLVHGSLEDRRLNILSLAFVLDLQGMERAQKALKPSIKKNIQKMLMGLQSLKRDRLQRWSDALKYDASKASKEISSRLLRGDDKEWAMLQHLFCSQYRRLIADIRAKAVKESGSFYESLEYRDLSPYGEYGLPREKLVDESAHRSNVLVLQEMLASVFPKKLPHLSPEEHRVFSAIVLQFGMGVPLLQRTGKLLLRTGKSVVLWDVPNWHALDFKGLDGQYLGKSVFQSLMNDENIEGFLALLDPDNFKKLGIPFLEDSADYPVEDKIADFVDYCAKEVELFTDQDTGAFDFDKYFRVCSKLLARFEELYAAQEGRAIDREALMQRMTMKLYDRGMCSFEEMYESLRGNQKQVKREHLLLMQFMDTWLAEERMHERLKYHEQLLKTENNSRLVLVGLLGSWLNGLGDQPSVKEYYSLFGYKFEPKQFMEDWEYLLEGLPEEFQHALYRAILNNDFNAVNVFNKAVGHELGFVRIMEKTLPSRTVFLQCLNSYLRGLIQNVESPQKCINEIIAVLEYLRVARPDIRRSDVLVGFDMDRDVMETRLWIYENLHSALDSYLSRNNEAGDQRAWALLQRMDKVFPVSSIEAIMAAPFQHKDGHVPDKKNFISLAEKNIQRLYPSAKGNAQKLMLLANLFIEPDVKRKVSDYALHLALENEDFPAAWSLVFGEHVEDSKAFVGASLEMFVEHVAQTPIEMEKLKQRLLEIYRTRATEQRAGEGTFLDGFFKYCYDHGDELIACALESRNDEEPLLRLLFREWWQRTGKEGAYLDKIMDPSALDYFDDKKVTQEWTEIDMSISFVEEAMRFEPKFDPIHLLSVNEVLEKLYNADMFQRHLILRKTLTDPQKGILRNKAKVRALAKKFMKEHLNISAGQKPVVDALIDAFVEAASSDDMYFLLAPLLSKAIFQRPPEQAKEKKRLVRDSFQREEAKRFGHPDDDKSIWCTELRHAFTGKDGEKYRTQGDCLVGKATRFAFTEKFLGRQILGPEYAIYDEMPEEYKGLKGLKHFSEMDTVLSIAQQLGAVGVRFLQILGQYMELSPEVEKEFSQVFDSIYGQSKLAAFETIRREAPDLVGPEDRMVRRIGGGSLVSVYEMLQPDGKKYVLKVLNPNAEARVRDAIALIRKVMEILLKKDPTNKNYLMVRDNVLPDLEAWLIADINDAKFLENDKKFRQRYSGFAPPGYRFSMYVPESYEPNYRFIKREEYIEGVNFKDLQIGAKTDLKAGIVTSADYKQIASLTIKNYMMQIQDGLGLVHSDAHQGNFRIMPDGRIAILDRNFYLEWTADDRKFIQDFTAFSFEDYLIKGPAAMAGEKIGQLVDYLLVLPENKKLAKKKNAIMAATIAEFTQNGKLESLITSEGLSDITLFLKKQGLKLPLKMTLLVKNFAFLNNLARKAGFQNLAEVVLYDPAHESSDDLKPSLTEMAL